MIASTRIKKPSYSTLVATIKIQAEQLADLKFQLTEMQRLIFGTKSERFVPAGSLPGAPTLFDLPAVQVPVETVQKTITVPVKKKNEGHPGRNPLPAHLPRQVTVLEPLQDVSGLTQMGQDVTEMLDYTPGKLIVRQYIRPKYARPKGAGIVMAELPEFPITKGIAGSGLLTQLIISKFVDGLPIYRQVEMFKRQEVELSTATIAGWIKAATELLFPLYENLQKQVLASGYAQVDETRLQVLDRLVKGKSIRGWIWAYHSPTKRLVMFDYAEGRGKENPVKHLQHFQGYLQVDGYSVYDGFGLLPGITMASCWAHCRREFFEAKDYDLPRAEHILGEIGLLYDLERTLKGLSEVERKCQREETAIPILDRLHAYLLREYAAVLPSSPIGKALNYALKRWKKLLTYTQSGALEIDSNLIENSIRPIAVGRKAFLFAGSHEGAQRIAMLYSFMGSCKKNEVEPFAWLKKTLEILPSWPANRIHELLPNYKPE